MIKKLAVFFCVLLVSGCGYTTRSLISKTYKTIYIPPVVNRIDITNDSYSANKYKIYRPGLETDLTKRIINRFMFDGNIRPIKQENADLILHVELIEFRKDSLRYNNDNDEVDEYRVNVVLRVSLLDTATNTEVWKSDSFTGDTTYFPTTSSLRNVTKKSEEQAIADAIEDVSRRIVERTVEDW